MKDYEHSMMKILKKVSSLRKKARRLQLLFFLLFPLGSFAQGPIINLSAVNLKVDQIIKQIENQTDYVFFYNNKDIDQSRRITYNKKGGNLNEVLTAIFGYNKYRIENKKIILTPAAEQKKNTVTGIITDSHGDAIIGANIVEKGTTNGTITDIDGKYVLTLYPNAILQISYLGYETKEVNISTKRVVNIQIYEDVKTLEEVVVVGYGTQAKKSLTGAVSVMNMKEIEASSVSTISHAMAGKAAGLRVNQVSAQPGGAAKFLIRGEGSTGAGNSPLFVIDGFPVGNSGSLGSGNIYDAGQTDNVMESLNPNDIESITVLKDAASTAIYGSRAGHGVILITTKRGKNKKPAITYSASGSVQNMRSKYQMLDVKSFMVERNEQEHENYLKSNGLGMYADYIARPDGEISPFKPIYTNDQIYQAKETDWLGEVMRLGYMQQHNISMNGGTESTRYMLSLNYMDQGGIIKGNGANRFSTRLNLDQEISKYIIVGLNAMYAHNEYNNVPLGNKDNEVSGVLTSAIQSNPANPVYDEDGNYYIDPLRSFVPNAVSLLEIEDVTKKDRVMASAYLLVKPIKGLELKAQLGADRKFQKRSNYLPKTTLEGQKHNGSANVAEENGTDYLMDLTATYSNTFNGNKIKALAGYSFQKFTTNGMNAGNKDFIVDGFIYNNLGAGAYPNPTVGSYAATNSLGSYFARANYSYLDRYLIEATVRADGASNFAPENRWGYFPSVSVGWVLSEEKFMKRYSSWLDNTKIRASFGQTGNSNVGNRTNSYYKVGHNYVFGDVIYKGVFASELGNKNLTWETTTEFNIGLDLSFLNSRIRFSAEYFDRKITDLLVANKSIPSYNEITSIAANIGSTQSQGVELTLNTVNIKTKDFSWNSTFTLSHYNDKWLKRDPNWKPASYQKVNDPIRAWWEYEAIGIMQPGETAPKAQANLLPGMMKLKDQDNNNVINQDDRIYVDNGDPKIIFGFNNGFSYKNFDLNIYFYGESGAKKSSSYLENWTIIGKGQNVSVNALNSFDSKNTTSTHPTYIEGGNGWGDYYVKSIYYIRCGTITLGYNVPISKKIVRNLRLYADVSNPFVITNWTGLDPETDTGNFSYPNVTSYSFGLNLTF